MSKLLDRVWNTERERGDTLTHIYKTWPPNNGSWRLDGADKSVPRWARRYRKQVYRYTDLFSPRLPSPRHSSLRLDLYTHTYTYISTLTRSLKNEERDGERERRIVMEKGYGRGERERGGGERMKDREEGVEVTVEGRKWRRTRAEKIKRGLKSGD